MCTKYPLMVINILEEFLCFVGVMLFEKKNTKFIGKKIVFLLLLFHIIWYPQRTYIFINFNFFSVFQCGYFLMNRLHRMEQTMELIKKTTNLAMSLNSTNLVNEYQRR